MSQKYEKFGKNVFYYCVVENKYVNHQLSDVTKTVSNNNAKNLSIILVY